MTGILSMAVAGENMDRGGTHEPARAATKQAVSRSEHHTWVDQGAGAVQSNVGLDAHHAAPWRLVGIHSFARGSRSETRQHGRRNRFSLACPH